MVITWKIVNLSLSVYLFYRYLCYGKIIPVDVDHAIIFIQNKPSITAKCKMLSICYGGMADTR